MKLLLVEKAWLAISTLVHLKGVLTGLCAGQSSSPTKNLLKWIIIDQVNCACEFYPQEELQPSTWWDIPKHKSTYFLDVLSSSLWGRRSDSSCLHLFCRSTQASWLWPSTFVIGVRKKYDVSGEQMCCEILFFLLGPN